MKIGSCEPKLFSDFNSHIFHKLSKVKKFCPQCEDAHLILNSIGGIDRSSMSFCEKCKTTHEFKEYTYAFTDWACPKCRIVFRYNT